MNLVDQEQPEDRAPAPEFAERCRELGLPVWRWDPAGALADEPDRWGDADAWLRAPRLRELLEENRAAWPDEGPPRIASVFPGCWMLPIADVHDDLSVGIVAPLALGSEVKHTEQFRQICASAELDPDVAFASIQKLACRYRSDLDHLARTLAWMHGDLSKSARDGHSITAFSKQLIDTYEQMSLLYRVGELMNGLADPHGFLNMTCTLLHSTLEFRWIAMRLSSLPSLGRALANELVLVGEIPCSHTRYDKLAGELAAEWGVDSRPEVVDQKQSELAVIVGSEIFVNPLICDSQLAGLLLAGNKDGDDPEVSSSDMQLISATADFVSAFLHNSAMYNEQKTTFLGIIKALSASIDAKDRYTRGHSERVAHLASQLSLAIGYTEEQAERVRLAGILHDMGKIGVPEKVLLKPGRLTEEEFGAIKKHPTIGYNILKDIEPLQDVLPGVLYHHERWDGGGYPQGLKGSAIPLIGRILAVADSFDAMSSDRAYRPRMARETVLREMEVGAGAQWDHELVKVFLKLDFSQYDAMIERHAAQESMAA